MPKHDKRLIKERGDRIKWLRRIANLDRRTFAEKYHLNYETLKGWENGKHGGITQKRAQYVIQALKEKAHIECSVEWLMYAVGEGPQISYEKDCHHSHYSELLAHFDKKERIQIQKELEVFSSSHKNIVATTVHDHSMEPCFQAGDIIAGVAHYNDEAKSCEGKVCILHDLSGKFLLRKIEKNPLSNKLTLIALNNQFKPKKIVLDLLDIIAIAPVIWHRKSLKSLF